MLEARKCKLWHIEYNRRSYRKMKIKRRLFVLFAVIAGLGLCGWLFFRISLWRQVAHTSPAARSSLERIVSAYWLSRITGDYWTNSIFETEREIDILPENEQLIFYRELLIFSAEDLDTSRAHAFLRAAGKTDLKKFHKVLEDFLTSDRANTLNPERRQAIRDWDLEITKIAANCDERPYWKCL